MIKIRTFIYYFTSKYIGGVIAVQAEHRMRADQMFVTEMLRDKEWTEDNLKWREGTGARVIDEEAVSVQVIPLNEEHLTVVMDGDY